MFVRTGDVFERVEDAHCSDVVHVRRQLLVFRLDVLLWTLVQRPLRLACPQEVAAKQNFTS